MLFIYSLYHYIAVAFGVIVYNLWSSRRRPLQLNKSTPPHINFKPNITERKFILVGVGASTTLKTLKLRLHSADVQCTPLHDNITSCRPTKTIHISALFTIVLPHFCPHILDKKILVCYNIRCIMRII